MRGKEQRRVVVEDAAFQRAQLLARVQPDRVERLPCRSVGVQRVGRAVGPVEREHELARELPVERVLSDHGRDLVDHLRVAPAQKLGVDERLLSRQPLGEQRRALGERPQFVREVGERLVAPEGERLAQDRRPLGVVLLRARTSDGEPEAPEVDLLRRDVEDVSRRAEDDPLGADRPAQLRDVVLQRVAGSRRRTAAPEVVDQALGRHHLPRLKRQQCEQGAL
jgi:hypothetical protein